MIEDTRLFSANNPIGRVWYYINLFVLGFLFAGAHIGVKEYILPSANASYTLPINCILYFAYLILIITFFMLIDRRLYDIFGSRDEVMYNKISKGIGFVVFLFVLTGLAMVLSIDLSDIFYKVLTVFSGIFALFVFILGLFPGKLTSK